MVISRTPFRISFFGGGTDYPVWYREHGGAVLASTINKYCYISCRYLPPFFEHKSRIVWSKIERVNDHSKIQHPAAREALGFMQIKDGVEIHHDGDLPARSGLGSSSAFTVGFLLALHALNGAMPGKKRLADEAIHIEKDRLKENVGCQDQILTAYGGFNLVEFEKEDSFTVSPVILPKDRLEAFQDHLMLFFTGFQRTASDIAGKQIAATKNKTSELKVMFEMVKQAQDILSSNTSLVDFGNLLHENWQIKKSLTNVISTTNIDDIYNTARKAGAIGGKLLGAGGGGFILFFVRPDKHLSVKRALGDLLHVPFEFDRSGSQVIFNE
jgi:D-glycero-alpha-D-manno-heptose-7-phosphate kinase